MHSIGRWLGHLIGGMVQGCLIVGVTAAVVATVATYVATRHAPHGWEIVLIVAIVIVSGLFGAASALAWRISHLPEIVHMAKQVSEHNMRAPGAS